MEIKYFLAIMLISIFISSCDEIDKIFNPSSDYLIEKTVKPSSDEQVFESGSEFKMIFPANSISNNLEVKVKKESSAPEMNIPNQKPGKNFFKIKFSGDAEFLQPVKLIINFDKSAVPAGKTAQESVFGYIYSSGTWKLAEYQLDEPNGKIIISISSINGQVGKDEPILLDDGEVIIGTFTPTDAGNSDNLLKVMRFYEITFFSNNYTNGRYLFTNIHTYANQDSDTIPLIFSGDNFTCQYDSDPSRDPATISPEDTFMYLYTKFNVSGQVSNGTHSIINNFNINIRKYHASQIGWDDEKCNFSLSNVKLTYQSKTNDTLVYVISKEDIKSKVTSFSWNYDDLWEAKKYSQSKTDLTKLSIKFTR